ncbi:hypothetical protein Bp8pS_178 [Bacillus phage vB_BpuM-BpSp]|nr:hypothetical protein Bp8pS_178 [Bacillus phage vB_BpuM-BpSp]
MLFKKDRRTIKKNVEYEGVKYSIGVKFNGNLIEKVVIYNDKGKIKYQYKISYYPSGMDGIIELIELVIISYNREIEEDLKFKKEEKLLKEKITKGFNEWDGKL